MSYDYLSPIKMEQKWLTGLETRITTARWGTNQLCYSHPAPLTPRASSTQVMLRLAFGLLTSPYAPHCTCCHAVRRTLCEHEWVHHKAVTGEPLCHLSLPQLITLSQGIHLFMYPPFESLSLWKHGSGRCSLQILHHFLPFLATCL